MTILSMWAMSLMDAASNPSFAKSPSAVSMILSFVFSAIIFLHFIKVTER